MSQSPTLSPRVGGVWRRLGGSRARGNDLHPVVDVVSDPDVLVLAAPRLALALTEVDVEVMESDRRMRSARSSATPPCPALRLPDEVKSADDGDQAEHDHKERHDADPDDGVGRGVERDQVRRAPPFWICWTSPGSRLVIPEECGHQNEDDKFY